MRPVALLMLPLLCLTLFATGCESPPEKTKDYDRPLPPGASGLRKLYNPADWPDVEAAFPSGDTAMVAALDRSLTWFTKPSSARHFPVDDVTHLRARTSVFAFRTLLSSSRSPAEFRRALQREFDCYISVGCDDRGTVLFTGYYAPIFKASRTRTATYRFPLYAQPNDLVKGPDGKIEGRRLASGRIAPYPTRAEIENQNLLAGTELYYLPSKIDAYIIHVNGSAKLTLTDGSTAYVGYAANNGHEYTSIRAALLKDGKIGPHDKLAAIKRHFDQNPGDYEKYTLRNDRYVFFAEYDGSDWPAGSLGFPVTGFRSVATDKSVFPRAGVVMVDTTLPVGGQVTPFKQFMMDQDTGGAIRAAGRADLFLGIGASAERMAGAQAAEGQMYYWFLKHDRVLNWNRQMQNNAAAGRAARRNKATTPGAPTRTHAIDIEARLAAEAFAAD